MIYPKRRKTATTPRKDGELFQGENMNTDLPNKEVEARAGVMPAPEVVWARPLWITGRYGIGACTLERAWRAGKITRSKLDDGRAGTVVYLVADVENWIADRIDRPEKKMASKGASPHSNEVIDKDKNQVGQPVESMVGAEGGQGTTSPNRP